MKKLNITSASGEAKIIQKLNAKKLDLEQFKPIDELIKLSLKKVELLHDLKLALAAKLSKAEYCTLLLKIDDESGFIYSQVIEHDTSKARAFEGFIQGSFENNLVTTQTESRRSRLLNLELLDNLDNDEQISKLENTLNALKIAKG